MEEFSPQSLVDAVRKLFELNQYDCKGPLKIHGAEVDLLASRKADPFSSPVFIEVTIEYVDNDKYGKDVSKLMLVREKHPDAQLLIVSSTGFSPAVIERAVESRIKPLTYQELFSQFERFDPYITSILGDSQKAAELRNLNAIYEEPLFEDRVGREHATGYLTDWRDRADERAGWLVVTGEYGTGKTALTKILQYRWMTDHHKDPSLPIPLRVELRDFSRQFDARGLLHHFLDHNQLGHIPIDFVLSLIRSGRIILILDGYDEMAQHLHALERRACLEALAELSTGGARGILTSRPNYFTEGEELQVFEILYASLKHDHYYLDREARALLEKEARIDQLLEQFLDRFERSLQDLTPEQTEALVQRILGNDEKGQEAVLRILRSIFRGIESIDARSLSGKPVIISYLLEVVEDLKSPSESESGSLDSQLTEWQVYQLIVNHLMLRDLRRSPELAPTDRRRFLHKLSVFLSRPSHSIITEDEFRDLILREFSREFRRFGPDQKAQQVEKYFADLRGSATLTRSADPGRPGWRFSHNSLREYLLSEHLMVGLESSRIVPDDVPVSDAMRLFAASRSEEDRRDLLERLGRSWGERLSQRGMGQLLTLLWDGLLSLSRDSDDPVRETLQLICGVSLALNGVILTRLALSRVDHPSNLSGASFSSTDLSIIDFPSANLRGADFSESTLENVNFAGADLSGSRFSASLLVDVSVVGTNLQGADFRHVNQDDISLLVEDDRATPRIGRLEGQNALGYLRYQGALTDALPVSVVLRHHPKYSIMEKIIEKLAEQNLRQRRGLEQRGEARQDVPFARRFVEFLESRNWVKSPKNRKDLLEVTEAGREVFRHFAQTRDIPSAIAVFLEAER